LRQSQPTTGASRRETFTSRIPEKSDGKNIGPGCIGAMRFPILALLALSWLI
jgi:hypothetical protein